MSRIRWLLLGGYAAAGLIAAYICAFVQRCNNFAIYRWAFTNLSRGRNLYGQHPGQHWDLFKYSPSFALLIAPFSLVPFSVGMALWDLLNALVLFYAIHRLLPGRKGDAALLLVFAAFVLTTDGSQVNPLLAGLTVIAFVSLERLDLHGDVIAAFAITVGTITKIFPIAAAALAVRRSGVGRFVAILSLTLSALLLAPLVLTSPALLAQQYAWWRAILASDVRATGVSLLESLAWAGFSRGNVLPEVAGLLVLLAPLMLRDGWDTTRRRLFLCSILLYVVLFNPQAERPSFILALTGASLWYVTGPRSPVRTALMLILAAAASLSMAADISHGSLATWRHAPLQFLVLSCAAIWLVVQLDLWGASEWLTRARPIAIGVLRWRTRRGVAALLLLALSAAADIGYAQDALLPRGKPYWISAAAMFASALAADEQLRSFAASHHNAALDRVADDLEPLGRAQYVVPVLVAAAVLPRIVGRDTLANAALRVGLGYVASDVAGGIFRVIVARQRPDSTGDPWRFRPFRPRGAWGSMPSAHATHAFAVAAGIAELSHDRRLAILCYAAATLVATQRVYDQAHWTSDAVGGAIVATAVSRATVHLRF